MNPDDYVCLCYRVSLSKVQSDLAQENPKVASLISDGAFNFFDVQVFLTAYTAGCL